MRSFLASAPLLISTTAGWSSGADGDGDDGADDGDDNGNGDDADGDDDGWDDLINPKPQGAGALPCLLHRHSGRRLSLLFVSFGTVFMYS